MSRGARASRAAGALLAGLVLLGARGARAEDCPQIRPTDAAGFEGYVYPAGAKSFATPEGNGRIWWTETGANAPSLTSTRPDGVPDAVAVVGVVLEEALAGYAKMGFKPPISDGDYPACASNGGDGRVDVYLVAFAGADGQTVTERCTTTPATGAAQRCPGFILAERNFKGKGYASQQQGAQTVVAHELFHLVQNAYDTKMDRWWAEGTAQWSTKQLYPTLLDLEANLPAFFSEVGRPLDSPPSGATAGFLYGSAIWPVFLAQHRGQDTVKLVMESIGAGNAVLPATDRVMTAQFTTLAEEFGTFAIWNSATGTRAGAGGYPDAAKYPLVKVTDFPDGTPAEATGLTAGFASMYFRTTDAAPRALTLEADATRLGGYAVPIEGGKVQVAKAIPLPAVVTGEALVVLAGRASKKTDVPFTLRAAAPDADAGPTAPTAPSDTSSGGGCAIEAHSSRERDAQAFAMGGIALLGAIGVVRRRRRSG